MIKILLDIITFYVISSFILGFVIAYAIYKLCGREGVKEMPIPLQWVVILTAMVLWPRFVIVGIRRKMREKNMNEEERRKNYVDNINNCIDYFNKRMEEDP